MSKYLLNPIRAFENIKDHYILYTKTAFGTRFKESVDGIPSFEEEREELLRKDQILSREVWIEPLPSYAYVRRGEDNLRISTLTPQDLPSLNPNALQIFKDFITRGLIDGDFPIYKHQYEMLCQATAGIDSIITSGTGSGKTESFLLPLLADIIKEGEAEWGTKTSSNRYKLNDWWNAPRLTEREFLQFDDSNLGHLTESCCQRPEDDNHTPALRGLIIYPMNALVEDQMTRLRKALDSDEIQEFLDEGNHPLKGHRIFFGQYNGATPVPGIFERSSDAEEERRLKSKRDRKKADLKEAMQSLEKQTQNIQSWVNKATTPEERKFRKELKYTFKRAYGKNGRVSAEMRTRFDIQQTPPDILITNYSMLAIMLMRTEEQCIFEKTRRWLEGETDKENPKRIFHLVIDELHLNRGTSGTEIAYLLRLVLNRLGLTPDSKQLRILSSSASLDTSGDAGAQSFKFLKDFFGRDFGAQNIVPGVEIDLSSEHEESDFLPHQPFIEIAKAYLANPEYFDDASSDCLSNLFKKVTSQISAEFNIEIFGSSDFECFLNVLNSNELALATRFRRVFDCGEFGSNRAIPFAANPNDNNVLGKYFVNLFSPNLSDDELREAAEGLIISRGLFDQFKGELVKPLNIPRLRFHFFYKNVGGLWATIDDCDWTHNRPVGRLHDSPKLVDEKDDKRVLELLYCESCGAVLYGGKRATDANGDTRYLLPNTCNIEALPEQSSQPIVDRRSYSDYAIFWPIDKQDEEFGSDRFDIDRHLEGLNVPMKHRSSLSSKNKDLPFTCSWEPYHINKFSGEVRRGHEDDLTRFVNGYLYVVNATDPRVAQSPALPTHCPCCGADRSKASSRAAVLRGFRAGFSKSTQLYAKELFNEIPTINTPKLVTFSDSREDAASIANGIERYQYNDLLRELFLEVCTETNSEEIAELDSQIQELKQNIEDLIAVNNPRLQRMIDDNQKELEKVCTKKAALTEYTKLSDVVSSEIIFDSSLYKRFFELGVNPAGCDWEVQKIDNVPWYEMPNYRDNNEKLAKFKEISLPTIKAQITSLFFGRLYYGLESAGIGIVCLKRDKMKAEEALSHHSVNLDVKTFFEIVDSVIRLLGENYRYKPNIYDIEGLGANSPMRFIDLPLKHPVRRYLNACAIKHGIPLGQGTRKAQKTNALGDAISEFLRVSGCNNFYVDCDVVYIKRANQSESLLQCPHCKKKHLHLSGGICTGCFKPLNNPVSIPINEAFKSNYVLLNQTIGRPSLRLHCEELTGQTDDQALRQRQFRDFIIAEEGQDEEMLKRVQGIDILSVTTTMEVGVDIGSLQAVMLANMPPQRFNYQQRVGRGGRRGQAYSMILTLCQGRSHDEHFFHNPHQITGDQPPVPFLSMDAYEIAQRLFTKEVLFYAFRASSQRLDGSTHGEFGKKSDWLSLRPTVETWINNNASFIRSIAQVVSGENTIFIPQLEDFAANELVNLIDSVIATPEISANDLAESLAEGGLLPMYGMPTRNRELFTKFLPEGNNRTTDLSSVSRDLQFAISAFSPGSQITKDKSIYTAIGFAPSSIKQESDRLKCVGDDKVFTMEKDLLRCTRPGCPYFRTVEPGQHNISDSLEEVNETCEICGSPIEKIQLRTPAAFITDLTPGENRQIDTDLSIRRKGVISEKNDEEEPIILQDSRFEISLAKKDFTWRISDQDIEGGYCDISYSTPRRAFIRSSAPQWIANPILSDQPYNFASSRITIEKKDTNYKTRIGLKAGEQLERIRLAAQKITNVFKLKPSVSHHGIDLDPFQFTEYEGKKSFVFQAQGIRAAYYSLAFVLQRALASNLDIDPVEIDVVEPQKSGDVGQIVLSDELMHGSGFVVHLFNHFDDYINQILNPQKGTFFDALYQEKHRETCDSSCYECLSNYNNMPYHGLLDWRLAIALFRYMTDQNYEMGITGNFDYPELDTWRKDSQMLLRTLYDSFFRDDSYTLEEEPNLEDWDLLPYIKVKGKYIIAVHPLWKSDSSNEILADTCFDLGIDIEDAITVDSFNLLRRLGNCYEVITRSDKWEN